MNPPDFTLDKIKYKTDGQTFKKAVDLYQKNKVADVKEGIRSYSGLVLGTQPYRVGVEARNLTLGFCECYLGKQGITCKHLVALCIYLVQDGKPLLDEDTKQYDNPICSKQVGDFSQGEIDAIKAKITKAISYIKPFNRSSSSWFTYQNSLSEGCRRLSAIVSNLPVNQSSYDLVVNLIERLDKKLVRVDDSDGTVSSFIFKLSATLQEFPISDPQIKTKFLVLVNM